MTLRIPPCRVLLPVPPDSALSATDLSATAWSAKGTPRPVRARRRDAARVAALLSAVLWALSFADGTWAGAQTNRPASIPTPPAATRTAVPPTPPATPLSTPALASAPAPAPQQQAAPPLPPPGSQPSPQVAPQEAALVATQVASLVASLVTAQEASEQAATERLLASGAPIVAIAVQPPPARTAAAFLPLVQQPLHQPVDRALVRSSIQHLFATGDFARVRALAFPAPGGLRLFFATDPNYFIGSVEVQHAPDPPSDGELQDASRLELGKLYTAESLAQGQRLILTRMRSYGYYQARVDPQVQLDRDTAMANVVFILTAGPLVRLGTVRIEGTPLYPTARLLQAAKLHPGVKLSRERLDNSLQRLQKFYGKRQRLTAAVDIINRQYVAGNRLNLVLRIEAGPLVTVDALGKGVSQRMLKKQVPIFQEHAADAELIEEGRENIRNSLQVKGYYEATVDDRRSAPNSNHLRITYLVNRGDRESLDAIAFSGNKYFDEDTLADRLALRPSSFLPDIIPGARGQYSDQLVKADATSIANLYRANGFANVVVTPIVNRRYKGKANHLQVRFQIREGTQTLVSAVHLVGNHIISNDEIEGELTSAPGQPYSDLNVATDRDSILNYYYNNGFQEAQCNSIVKPLPGQHRQDVTYVITEGPQLRVNQVFITGERFVKRATIAHQLDVHAGQRLGQKSLLDSQRKLYDLGLFTDANVVPQNELGTERAKNVVVEVHEARRYTFGEGLGAQFQNGHGCPSDAPGTAGTQGPLRFSPLASFEMTRLAVTGREQTLSLRGDYGTLQKRALLSYDFNRFINHPNLKLDLTALYDNTCNVQTFRAIRQQVGLQLEQKHSPTLRSLYSLDFHRIRVPNADIFTGEQSILGAPVSLAMGSYGLVLDRRDDPLDTHHGRYISAQVGLAQSFRAVELGSKTPTHFANFTRFFVQHSWYTPLGHKGNIILAQSTKLGFEVPFGPRQVITLTNPVTGVTVSSAQHVIPLPERFFSGGADSLRGFAINQAGPRDPVTGAPIGGNALLVSNLELRFPLIGQNIGGVAFYDAGNVYTTISEVLHSLTRLRAPSTTDLDFTSHTLGLGLRYRTPVGPVRIDMGYNVNPPRYQTITLGTPTQPAAFAIKQVPHLHFFFSIGQTF